MDGESVALILITAVCLYQHHLTRFHRHLQRICSLAYTAKEKGDQKKQQQ